MDTKTLVVCFAAAIGLVYVTLFLYGEEKMQELEADDETPPLSQKEKFRHCFFG